VLLHHISDREGEQDILSFGGRDIYGDW